MSETHEPAPESHFEEGEEAPPRGVRFMAALRWLLILAMATAAALSIRHAYLEDAAHSHDELEYYCPMHPQIVQRTPGLCPICNMNLVPRQRAAEPPKQSEIPGLVEVVLPHERVQRIGLETATVEQATLTRTISAPGVVTLTESNAVSVQTRYAGWIEQLASVSTGHTVRRGELLARIYSPELVAAQQELLQARAWSKDGAVDRLTDDARTRLLTLGMNESEIDEVVRTGKLRREVELRAPVSGYLAKKNVTEGQSFTPGTQLFQIGSMGKVWVLVDVAERDAAHITIGQPAKLSFVAHPGQQFDAAVQLIEPELTRDSGSLRVRLTLSNGDLTLRPGMLAEAKIAVETLSASVIPREALIDTGDRRYVFVAGGQGRFTPRAVEAGHADEQRVQIVRGLALGERVVTNGNFLIDSESRLNASVTGAHAH